MRTGATGGVEHTIPRPLRVRMRASRRVGLPLLPLLFAVPAAVSALRDLHPEPATFAAVLGLAPPADRAASRARRRRLARNVVLPVGFSIAFVALVVLAARWSAGV